MKMVGVDFIDFPPGNSVFNNAVKLLSLWIQTDALANTSGIKTYYEFGRMRLGVEITWKLIKK